MKTNSTVHAFQHPETLDDPLTSVLREGARRLLAQAVEAEADTFLAAMADERLLACCRFVDTEIRCLTELESWNAETEVQPRVQG